MRTLLVLVALLAGGYAGYRELGAKTSYASYSPAQLDELEAELQRQLLKASGDAFDTHQLSLTMLRQERSRRFEVQAALGVAGLSFVSALGLTLVTRIRGRRRADTSSGTGDEEPRDTPEPIGHYRSAGKAARAQAAALLGVRMDAPRAVIEAALQAQLAEKDPAQLHGMDPELRRRVLQQREALVQAANLLLGRQQEISLPSDISPG